VSQNRVTGPIDIYNELTGDTTFMSSVGSYVFKDGSTNDAISIVTPSKPIPSVSSISGLEVLIHDTGIPNRIDYITGSPDISVTYNIFLILWDPGNGTTLTNACSRAMQIFSGSRMIEVIKETNNDNLLVQNMIEIPNNALILV
jgi:hypothetical protein